jgi:hypothetical protein
VGVVSSTVARDEIDGITHWLEALPLLDHHCHAVVDRPLDRRSFELLLGESGRPAPPGCSAFDTALGLSVRARCAPLLDLPPAVDAGRYVERRAELGSDEVNARLLAAGADDLLVDTGYRSDELADLGQMARWAGGQVREIVRLETLAESVAAGLAGTEGHGAGYAEGLAAAMDDQVAAVGWKTVAAYRGGLDLDWRRPGPTDVRSAAAEWLAAGPVASAHGPIWRLEHPVLIRHGVWAALDTGRPVQFHTGFGDSDGPLRRSDPALLSDLIAASADLGTPVMLLHCWPRHREAGQLANLWPHVYLDVGMALPHTGLRAAEILAGVLELAPWHKVLYSSDAFGLAELHHLGAVAYRAGLAVALTALAGLGFDRAELTRLATLVASGNARRVYPGLGTGDR